MKTAGRENPNRRPSASNRAHGAEGQNRSPSIKWAAKQEKLPPLESGSYHMVVRSKWRVQSPSTG